MRTRKNRTTAKAARNGGPNTPPRKALRSTGGVKNNQQGFGGGSKAEIGQGITNQGGTTPVKAVHSDDMARYQRIKRNESGAKSQSYTKKDGSTGYHNKSAIIKKMGAKDFDYYSKYGNEKPKYSDYK